jgi:hypothetical protein
MTHCTRVGGRGLLRAFTQSQTENALGYTIAAYGIVIGALAAYGLSIHRKRRKLMSRVARSHGGTGKI